MDGWMDGWMFGRTDDGWGGWMNAVTHFSHFKGSMSVILSLVICYKKSKMS